MLRPRYVSDAITIEPGGLHVGRYGPFELRAAYQPIFRRSGTQLSLCALEGLVRPNIAGAPLSPAELFMQVDPEDRLFVECMCRALHLRNYVHATPGDLDLYINVNPAIYASVEVIEREFRFMFSILPTYGVSPSRLVCELVEHDALDPAVLSRLCDMFRDNGARVALDDFGSGSSGMDRYRSVRPDVVKVDGPLFRSMSRTSGGRRLLASMSSTFLRDGTSLLVEGIESAVDLDIALEVGADLAQGYGLGRPKVLPQHFAAVPDMPPSVVGAVRVRA
jgi:EAL domain-containing protein (putative c-di-GMP-specific phosphodiesterase class I)